MKRGRTPGRRHSGPASLVGVLRRRPRLAALATFLSLVFVASVVTATTVVAASPRQASTVARTDDGTVEGAASATVVRFLGVPYAAPPVGALRWRPPQPVAPWRGVRQATRTQPACAQGPNRQETSEDCLYLNVTVPRHVATRRPEPVMVWLHGGGFDAGAGSDYDPTRMATQAGVIVVTVDFRLGIYGYFGLPGLAGSGDFGLQDQQAALRWVHDNIAAFGGDPHDVTLTGESGGAVATCAQLTSPLSEGLFQRAIMESGNCDFSFPPDSLAMGLPGGAFFTPLAQVDTRGEAAAKTLKCQGGTETAEIACLRDKSPRQLNAEYDNFGVAATGTRVLPLDPATALREGLFHRMPILSGINRDEHRLVAGIFAAEGWWISAKEYPGLIEESYGSEAPTILAHYPLSRYGDNGALAWSAVFTDSIWVCSQLRTSGEFAAHVPTYTYEFADEHAQPDGALPASFPAGASHASEIPNFYDIAGLRTINSDYYTDQQRRLATTMIGYWTSFARTGDPNSGSAPAWPVSHPGSTEESSLQLAPGDHGIGLVNAYTEHQCGFWKTLSAS